MTRLLAFLEIQQQMRQRWADALTQSPEFEVYIPSTPVREAAIQLLDAVEAEFEIRLPQSFREAAAEWDLGRLELPGFPFASNGDYLARLRRLNAAVPGLEWWGDRDEIARPASLLAIAHGDPFMTLLDTRTGDIYAHAVDDGSANTKRVAPSLDMFLRAIGTCYLQSKSADDPNGLADSLVTELETPSGGPFWQELATMWADLR
jgi:hypothetical protein